jgi:hypothetical protein
VELTIRCPLCDEETPVPGGPQTLAKARRQPVRFACGHCGEPLEIEFEGKLLRLRHRPEEFRAHDPENANHHASG